MTLFIQRVDVCVATCDRPALLRRLLLSLSRQKGCGVELRVIVVDNSPTRSAQRVVQRPPPGLAVVYTVEPERNISLARNRGLRLVRSECFAIVDDDEVVSPHWMAHLLRVRARSKAHVVHGPVLPDFARGVSCVFRYGEAFSRPNPNTGATNGYIRNTGNCLIDSTLLTSMRLWFDPEFGLTGGEDTDFFRRADALGARFVWCREAEVREWVPPERACFRWWLRRHMRNGAVFIKCKRLKPALSALCLGSLAALSPFSAAFHLSILPLGLWKRSYLFFALRKLAFHTGALLFCAGWKGRGYEAAKGMT